MKKNSFKKAFAFLAKRDPLDIDRNQYMALLQNFAEKKGKEAIEKLAGFYLFAIEHKKEPLIKQCFAHDLYQANDEWMLPRSDSYLKYWEDFIS